MWLPSYPLCFKMDLQDSFLLPPSTCFELKSHSNSWLVVDSLRNTKFLKQQEESCVFFLLPCRDGRYMLQLPPASLVELHKHFTESCMQDCCQEENVQGYSEPMRGSSWFFCKQGQHISISQYTPESHEEFCFSLEFDDHGCKATFPFVRSICLAFLAPFFDMEALACMSCQHFFSSSLYGSCMKCVTQTCYV